jgi:hypothetical protein
MEMARTILGGDFRSIGREYEKGQDDTVISDHENPHPTWVTDRTRYLVERHRSMNCKSGDSHSFEKIHDSEMTANE